MDTKQETKKRKGWKNWLVFIGTVIVVFLLGLFASSIMEHRSESKLYFQMMKPISDWEPRNEVWGENFPREYESYMSTGDTNFKSKYGGSAKIDYLNKYPELVVLWAGYAFSKEYNQGRGHYHAIEDIQNILRTVQPQPATCWTCKSTDIPRLMNKMGPAAFYKKKWLDMGKEVVNPIGCQDCHDPKSMNLRVTRPALVEAYERRGKDINKATHQEMRSLVCAQCHVEYYFKGEGKYLTFPWDEGLVADSVEKYYDKNEFSDWTHGLSKGKMLKAQHPDYELFMTGIHAKRNIACADCHMPYKREGAIKFTDHKIQSPLNNISNSCQVCHRESEETLRNNVYEIQEKVEQTMLLAEKNLALLHIGIKLAMEKGATEAELSPVLKILRHAQWRWDWISASNSMGFHSPVEAMRILASSIDMAKEGRIQITEILLNKGVKLPYAMPDLSTKEKAQKYIGLDMVKITTEKNKFKKEVLPGWLINKVESKTTSYK